tara:strand:+ start:10048 stop:11742 length:1695 start_codon:yes stop_codon:yes gene_type:complete
MNKLKNHKFLFPISIFLLFIINVLQGSSSELLADEAYYWVYSQYLDWGFFDHPPLVAVWITISDYIFNDEIGVRFFSAISFSILIYLVWESIKNPRKNEFTWLFILIFFSTALLNAYGFITTPDTPLMLFFGLFLFAYRKYISKKNTASYLFLCVAITGMMYSKYQGILIIFFVVLSNLKLIKDYRFWLVCLGSLVLYVPHLYWQYVNDFPSIKYHLYERASIASYKFEYTLMHFVNTIAILGFTFIIMYRAFFSGIKNKDLFHKALNYIIIGFFLFFLISSYRGHVQAQWIAPIIIPLIIITFNYLLENEKNIRLFKYLAFINIVVIILFRIIIANEGIIPIKLQFHGNKEWTTNIQQLTKNSDKLFINRFQEASIYWFYTKEKVHYQKNYLGRKNQFEFIPDNTIFTSDSISYLTRTSNQYSEKKINSSGKDSLFVSFIKNYKSLFDIEINFIFPNQLIFNKHSKKPHRALIKNPYDFDVEMKDIVIEIVFQNNKGSDAYSIIAKSNITEIKSKSQKIISLEFDTSLINQINEYSIVGIGIKTSEKMDLVKVSKLNKFKIID